MRLRIFFAGFLFAVLEDGLADDRLFGEGDDDSLCGNGGSDRLNGGLGIDYLDGEESGDTCVAGETLVSC